MTDLNNLQMLQHNVVDSDSPGLSSWTGQVGELSGEGVLFAVRDTTGAGQFEVRMHDGVTGGGIALMRADGKNNAGAAFLNQDLSNITDVGRTAIEDLTKPIRDEAIVAKDESVAAKDLAETYRDEAQTAMTTAQSAATTAGAHEQTAEEAKDAAKSSADAAKASEANAKTSETIASDSRTAASQSASAAASSASKALVSEKAAGSSEVAAEASAGKAKASEDAAALSATAAETALDEAVAAGRKATIGNIGDIQFTIRNDIPNGSVWCDGTEYSKAEFPDVYAMLVSGSLYNTTYEIFNDLVSNKGSCGFFALDSANEKFKVPSLNNIALEAGQLPVGFMAESLPQHTHTYQHFDGASAEWTGNSKSARNALADFTSSGANNPVYQDGAKVKTDRVVYRAYVVMYTGETEVSNAVVSEILDACARKDLSNVPTNYDFIVDSGSSTEGNQTAFYVQFKSGLLIQWGQYTSTNGVTTITFPKPYLDTSYIVSHGFNTDSTGSIWVASMSAFNKTITSWQNHEGAAMLKDWIAIGQGATE